MPTYAIGDIQGCFASLERLLARIAFDPAQDRLWLVGDLVNRGPRSADVLRFAMRHEGVVLSVLGNHDLHLLARRHGHRPAKRRDTMDDVLTAPDREALIDWLTSRPFVHRQGPWLLVHGGLLPPWTADEAVTLATEASEALQRSPGDFFSTLATRKPTRWDQVRDSAERLALSVAAFTRIRTVDSRGGMVTEFDGHPKDAPPGAVPWFAHPSRRSLDVTCLFGHWAALGLDVGPAHLALDSGCVWGRQLTAVRLEDRQVFQVDAVERTAG